MPVLRETIQTNLPVDEAFAFVADFANAAAWDPGTATSERIVGGPLAVGTRFRLGVRALGRIVPMEYRITSLDAPRRVVLVGTGSGIVATDDVTFEASGGGTRISYVAEIHLRGWLRILEPFASAAFAKIARDARDGMRRTLDDRAGASGVVAPGAV